MKPKALIFLVLFSCSLGFLLLTSQLAPQNQSLTQPLGINLSRVADSSTAFPFVDAFKSARPWLTQCLPSELGCQNPWNTEEENKLDLDEQGWIKSLPSQENPHTTYTRVGTLLYRDVAPYPGGTYLVLYEGEGTIEYYFDAVKDPQASRLGRDVIKVSPSPKGIHLVITATDPHKTGNYLRNIHVIQQADEKTYQQDIFNPKFLEKIRPFAAVRFMDWLRTNDSPQQNWQNRPQIKKAYYSGVQGVPLEILIKLANQLNISPWFNIPHQASEEYIKNFAQLVKDNLQPNLSIYLEYSNEVWNPQFQQFAWVRDHGLIQGQKTPYQSYGIKTAQMCDTWKQVFADRKAQVKCVMATQTASPDVAKQVLNCPAWKESPCYKHGIDILAITGYFSGELGKKKHQELVHSWLEDPNINAYDLAIKQLTSGKVFPTKDSLKDTIRQFSKYEAVAKNYGLKLAVYEGGSHVVGVQGVEQDQEITDFFAQLHRQEEFYTLYRELLQGWQNASKHRTLFMHYADISRPSKWGSWGVLEHLEQKNSPRYQALLDSK